MFKRFSLLLSLIFVMPLLVFADGMMPQSGKMMDKDSKMMATKFKVRIEDVSTTETLKLSNGSTAPAPVSPGLFVVFAGSNPVFVAGYPDHDQGLEAQSEDGNPGMLAKSVEGMKGVSASGVFNTPVGDMNPGPALPGKAFEFTFSAKPGDKLLFTTMFGQSNDLFFAPKDGIMLFDKKGKPMSGDITSQVELWDAGTEVNQEPGLGSDQAPRQSAPNTGTSEHDKVGRVKDSFKYPAVTGVIRVTITPEMGTENM